MLPDFRLPLATNGSFPQNENSPPIKASFMIASQYNLFLSKVKRFKRELIMRCSPDGKISAIHYNS